MNYTKDPQAVLDFDVDLNDPVKGPWLMAGETITAVTVTRAPAGLTIDSDSHTTTAMKVWLSGGTLGEAYIVTFHVTTNQGRQQDFPIRVQIAD